MPHSQERDDVRRALLDQVEYLVHEIDAVRSVIDRVPVPLQEVRPLDREPSIKELYGILVTLDEDVYLPRLRRIVADGTPSFDPVEEECLLAGADWNAQAVADILDRLRRARTALLDALSGLTPEQWQQSGDMQGARVDVFALAHGITQRDAEYLRRIGQRLHESPLTSRTEDLPR